MTHFTVLKKKLNKRNIKSKKFSITELFLFTVILCIFTAIFGNAPVPRNLRVVDGHVGVGRQFNGIRVVSVIYLGIHPVEVRLVEADSHEEVLCSGQRVGTDVIQRAAEQ